MKMIINLGDGQQKEYNYPLTWKSKLVIVVLLFAKLLENVKIWTPLCWKIWVIKIGERSVDFERERIMKHYNISVDDYDISSET